MNSLIAKCDNSPIFITGVARSGTTLLSVLLNNHSAIYISPEAITPAILKAPQSVLAELRSDLSTDSDTITAGLHAAVDSNKRLMGFETSKKSSFGYYDLAEKHLKTLATKHQKTIFGDKVPGMSNRLEILFGAFPCAKVIMLVRDPRAVVSSLNQRQNYPIGLGAHVWRVTNIRALFYSKLFGPQRMLIISYESLVLDTHNTLKTICEFLAIPYEEAMANILDSEATQKPNAYVLPSIDVSRLAQWKRELKPKQISRIESLCADVMQTFNYSFNNTIPRLKSLGPWGFIAENLKLNFQTLKNGSYTGMVNQQLVPVKVSLFKRIKVSLSNSAKLLFSSQILRSFAFDKRGFLLDLP